MIEAGLLDRRRGHSRLLRPLSRPDHVPDHRFPRPHHRLRRAGARRRCAGQIPELAGDAALPQEPRPLQRPGRPRRARARAGRSIAVEGYIDVIACVAAGFEATVAPLGTALTEDQLRMLWQMADEPILCFDGDEAGLKAAFRAIDLALPQLKPGKSVQVRACCRRARIPTISSAAKGRSLSASCSTAAKPLVDMLWLRATHGVDLATPERRAGLEQALRSRRGGDRAIADVRRHYEIAVRERVDARSSAQPAAAAAAPFPAAALAATRRRPAPAADRAVGQPSCSIRLVRSGAVAAPAPSARRRGADRRAAAPPGDRRRAARNRWRTRIFAGIGSSALAARADSLKLAEDAGHSARPSCATALEADGHGEALAASSRSSAAPASARCAEADAERAAAVWDDAAHLRLRTERYLSSGRQPPWRSVARRARSI